MEAPLLETSTGHVVYFIHPRNGSLSEEDTFGVARWQPENGGEPFAIKGNLYGVNKGERITVHGKWETHPKYGLQFAVDVITSYSIHYTKLYDWASLSPLQAALSTSGSTS